MHELILKKGGVLIGRSWDGEKKIWEDEEVTIPTVSQLHDYSCELEEGLTLRDIFLYVKKELTYWDLMLGNWCEDYVAEGLMENPPKDALEWDDITCEYLELYWSGERSKYKGKTSFDWSNRPSFHGQGKYRKDCENGYFKAGDQTAIGVSLTPMYELMDYEVKLDPEIKISEFVKHDGKHDYVTIFQADECTYTLFDILYGIFWEISFHGEPQSRNVMSSDLRERVKEIENGTAKLIPAEEVMKNMREKYDIDSDDE